MVDCDSSAGGDSASSAVETFWWAVRAGFVAEWPFSSCGFGVAGDWLGATAVCAGEGALAGAECGLLAGAAFTGAEGVALAVATAGALAVAAAAFAGPGAALAGAEDPAAAGCIDKITCPGLTD